MKKIKQRKENAVELSHNKIYFSFINFNIKGI